ncbi:MAG: Endoribonuclease [Bradyrhizobium sp.]|nr:Endoribonuclease [Bradyrhizobium sp.]
MDKILKKAGATFKDILKVTVLLTDVNDRTKINPVREKYFFA